MGVVGLGGTGREVATRALAFGMRVLAVDIEDVPTVPGIAALWKPDRMYDLLGESDVVVICLPLTKATHHLFSRDLFRRMKRTRDPHQRDARGRSCTARTSWPRSTRGSSGAPGST